MNFSLGEWWRRAIILTAAVNRKLPTGKFLFVLLGSPSRVLPSCSAAGRRPRPARTAPPPVCGPAAGPKPPRPASQDPAASARGCPGSYTTSGIVLRDAPNGRGQRIQTARRSNSVPDGALNLPFTINSLPDKNIFEIEFARLVRRHSRRPRSGILNATCIVMVPTALIASGASILTRCESKRMV